MLWDSSPNAGFSAATPWLPVAPDYQTADVQAQRDDPTSMLTLYHRLIALRRATPAMAVGAYTVVDAHVMYWPTCGHMPENISWWC